MVITYTTKQEYKERYGGRLERAYIDRLNKKGNALGLVDGSTVPIVGAKKYMGRFVLTRLDAVPGIDHTTLGSFITSKFPKDFRGLSSNGYILCGLWEQDMVKSSRVPTFPELYKSAASVADKALLKITKSLMLPLKYSLLVVTPVCPILIFWLLLVIFFFNFNNLP